jgi:quercetin dioxygenase-like cupin family protein
MLRDVAQGFSSMQAEQENEGLDVLEGTFTVELEGRPAVLVKAGESLVEPPNVKMITTGINRSP